MSSKGVAPPSDARESTTGCKIVERVWRVWHLRGI